MARDLKPVYTAVNATQAEARLEEFAEKWQGKYPAAVKLGRSAWSEFVPVWTTTWRSARSSARPINRQPLLGWAGSYVLASRLFSVRRAA